VELVPVRDVGIEHVSITDENCDMHITSTCEHLQCQSWACKLKYKGASRIHDEDDKTTLPVSTSLWSHGLGQTINLSDR
jgi:hypothetical protein